MEMVLDAMKKKYKKTVETPNFDLAGAAILDFLFVDDTTKDSIVLDSVLMLFHNGEVLLLRSDMTKNKVKAEWKDSLDYSKMTELETEEYFVKIILYLHKAMAGEEGNTICGSKT